VDPNIIFACFLPDYLGDLLYMNRSSLRVIIRYRNEAHVLDGPRFREPGLTIRLIMLDSGMQTARVRVIQNPHRRVGTDRRKISFCQCPLGSYYRDSMCSFSNSRIALVVTPKKLETRKFVQCLLDACFSKNDSGPVSEE
jgi:hypothetical protein